MWNFFILHNVFDRYEYLYRFAPRHLCFLYEFPLQQVYGSRSDSITASPTVTLTEVCYNPESAGSIPDGIIGVYDSLDHSDRTIAVSSTQPLREKKYQGYIVGVQAANAWG
jgi:hypothetical protein